VQDAYPIERYGWDLQLGPAASWPSSGGPTSALDAAAAWGVLPRTQLEIAAPLASVPDASGGRTSGLDGLELGALYGLNTETLSLPALAFAARYAAPVGSLAPPSSLLTLEGLATRGWPGFRVHVNAAVTIGPADGGSPDLALSSRPTNMALMEGQSYSLVFRRRYPKFDGLIWSSHWLQVGLYDALIAGGTRAEREANVIAATARFWAMPADPPARMPSMMPMTPAVAPRFTARYPEAAIIFDNLHSMHDVVSDILASPLIDREAKRAAILTAAARYRDDSCFVTTESEWRAMAASMGAEHMGGAAVP
jgi:hypothetical protein